MSLARRIKKLEVDAYPPQKSIVVLPLEDGESKEEAMERHLASGGKKPVGGRPYILFADAADMKV